MTASRAFLVSWSGGSIAAAADAAVAAAGGSIVARYANVGAVLARSSDPLFAAVLRRAAGVDAVGAVDAVHSAIELPRARPRAPSKAVFAGSADRCLPQ